MRTYSEMLLNHYIQGFMNERANPRRYFLLMPVRRGIIDNCIGMFMKSYSLYHLSQSRPGNLCGSWKWAQGFLLKKWHMSYGFLHIFIVVIYFSTWIYIILFWVIQLHVWIDDNRYWFYLNPFGIGTFEWKTFHRILYISFL